MIKEYTLLGVKVQVIEDYVVKEMLHTFLNSDTQHQIVTVNPEFIVTTRKNKKFLNVINESSLATIDGNGVIKALQFLGHDVSLDQRLTGTHLTQVLINIAIHSKYKILFCLHSQGLTTVEELTKVISQKYPELRFAVATETNALIKAQESRPRIVIVGFGAPFQDIWLWENLTKMPTVKIAMGVGGALDFISGKQKRAPKIFRSFGFEWLWRLGQQPLRLARIYRAIIIFPFLVIKYKYNQKKHENTH